MISPQDVVIAISNSGESSEILAVLPVLKRWGNPLICMTSNAASTMGNEADIHLCIRQWSSVLVVGSAWEVSMRCLVTGNDSPVSVDSSTCSPWPDTSRPSRREIFPGLHLGRGRPAPIRAMECAASAHRAARVQN